MSILRPLAFLASPILLVIYQDWSVFLAGYLLAWSTIKRENPHPLPQDTLS